MRVAGAAVAAGNIAARGEFRAVVAAAAEVLVCCCGARRPAALRLPAAEAVMPAASKIRATRTIDMYFLLIIFSSARSAFGHIRGPLVSAYRVAAGTKK